MITIPPALWLLSCSSGIGVARAPDSGEAVVDTGVTEPAPTEEDAGSYALEDAWIFAPGRIHTVAITLDEAGWSALAVDPYTAVDGDVEIDGVAMDTVGVRLRGKIGSFRTLAGKPKFEIDFNEFVEDQRFFGLEGLNLNNSVVDCSYLKERIGYRVFELAGVPALRTAYATVTVNDAPYGLYVLLEDPDDRFLSRVYADPGGNFYDGKYVRYDDGSYQLLDFTTAVDGLYQLEEGVDVGNADIHAITSAIEANSGQPGYYDAVGAVVDWEEYHRELAVEQWIGHLDGYAMNTNNYRVYFEPGDGRAEVVPWDFDYAFLQDSAWGMNWYAPRGVLASSCFADAPCAAGQKAAIQALDAALDTTALLAMVNALDALTYEATQADPRRECPATDVAASREVIRAWVSARPAELRAFWGL